MRFSTTITRPTSSKGRTSGSSMTSGWKWRTRTRRRSATTGCTAPSPSKTRSSRSKPPAGPGRWESKRRLWSFAAGYSWDFTFEPRLEQKSRNQKRPRVINFRICCVLFACLSKATMPSISNLTQSQSKLLKLPVKTVDRVAPPCDKCERKSEVVVSFSFKPASGWRHTTELTASLHFKTLSCSINCESPRVGKERTSLKQ